MLVAVLMVVKATILLVGIPDQIAYLYYTITLLGMPLVDIPMEITTIILVGAPESESMAQTHASTTFLVHILAITIQLAAETFLLD